MSSTQPELNHSCTAWLGFSWRQRADCCLLQPPCHSKMWGSDSSARPMEAFRQPANLKTVTSGFWMHQKQSREPGEVTPPLVVLTLMRCCHLCAATGCACCRLCSRQCVTASCCVLPGYSQCCFTDAFCSMRKTTRSCNLAGHNSSLSPK